MKTKTIEWIGPDRILPGHGVARRGDTKTLAEGDADSLIAQGLARPKRSKQSKSESAASVPAGDEA